MNEIRKYYFTGGLFLLFITLSFGQPPSSFPPITPSHIICLEGKDLVGDFCVDNLFMDNKGRIYFQPCGVMKSNFLVYFIQYDGFAFHPLELNFQELDMASRVEIAGYDKKLGFYGFLNHRLIGQSSLFIYQPESDSTILIKMEKGATGGILKDPESGFWIMQKAEEELLLYQWNGGQPKFVKSFPYPFLLDRDGQYLSLNDKPFIKDGDYIYYFDKCLPILKYNCKSHDYTFLDASFFPDTNIHENCNKRKPLHRDQFMEISDDKLYYLNTAYSSYHHIYTYQQGKKQFERLSIFPDDNKGKAIFKDEVGNLLFIYLNPQDVQKAILLDTLGHYWDYSGMTEQLPEIKKVIGSNFLKEAFIATIKGVFLVRGNKQKAISTFFPNLGLRWIEETSPQEYIIKAQGLYLLNTNSGLFLDLLKSPNQFYLSDRLNIKKPHAAPNGETFLIEGNSYKTHIYSINPRDTLSAVNYSFDKPTFPISAFLADGRLALLAPENQRTILWFDPIQQRIKTAHYNGAPIQFKNIQINYFLGSHDGHLWVASVKGIYKIHPDRNVFEYYGPATGLSDKRIIVLHEDSKGRIWAGTVKGGIQVFDPQLEKVVQIINAEKGLSNNTVVSILEDDNGDFWAGTFNGLNIISPDGKVIHKLYKEDGLADNEFNRYSFLKGSNGDLLMGTVNGLNVIDPVQVKKSLDKQDETSIYISSLTFYDDNQKKEVTLRNIDPEKQKIILQAKQRVLKINVGMSNYGFSQDNNFAYKLEGIHKEWNYLGKQPRIVLSNLPPGRYNLLINGIDERGNWAAHPIVLKVYAKDFFYRQTWFILLCIGVLTSLIFAWITYLQRERKRLEKEVKKRTRQIVKDKELIEQQAAELKQIDEIKSRFFTNISHELRTPVTLITTPVEQILRKYSKEFREEVKKSLQIVRNNSRKLLNLVEELLELSRIDAGKQQLSQTPTQLYSFCRQLFSAFESAAQLKQIDYQLKYDLDESLHFLIDKKRLEKIISNLLSNALKFTPSGGEVALLVMGDKIMNDKSDVSPSTINHQPSTINHQPSIINHQPSIIIKVSDSGRGIPPEDLPHIFDRYFQTKLRSIPKEGGTGIGLALAKELAELMNGTLSVKSQWEKGTTFTLEIPVTTVIDQAPTSSRAISQTPAFTTIEKVETPSTTFTSKQEKVLIVEDNPDMQQLLLSLLSDHYDCILAENGAKAWNLLSTNDPLVKDISLIVSDIMMPQMDGYELLGLVKNHTDWQKVPVIMLTARAAEDDKLQALRMGVDDYLIKPFSPEELLARITNLITNYQQRKIFIESNFQEVQVEFESAPSADQIWLKELETTVLEALNQGLDVNALYLADRMALSDRQMLRRLKALTGLSIKKYIQEVKLQKARHLLEQKSYHTLSEVSYACGFNTPGYFSQLFEKRFGKRAIDYLQTTQLP